MATTKTVIGPAVHDIKYEPGSTVNEILDSMGASLIAMGWELFDAAPHRVYRSLCANGTTYKYIKLGISTNDTRQIHMRAFEGWNATTHTGTNEAGGRVGSVTGSVASPTYTAPSTAWGDSKLQLLTTLTEGGYVTVLGGPRYAAMLGKDYQGILKTSVEGCFEWSVDVAEPTTAPFGMISSDGLLGRESKMFSASYSFNQITPPKVRNVTGPAAGHNVAIAFGPHEAIGFSSAASGEALNAPFISLPIANDTTTGLPYSYTPEVVLHREIVEATLGRRFSIRDTVIGRVYGIKVVAGAIAHWIVGDTVTMKVDANGFQVSTGGTDATHYVVPVSVYSALNYNNQNVRIAFPL